MGERDYLDQVSGQGLGALLGESIAAGRTVIRVAASKNSRYLGIYKSIARL
jgi:hypothetical protein